MIGLWEIIGMLVLIAIIYFVGRKAPGLARNTGESIREFKQGIEDIPGEVKKGMEGPEKKPAKKSTKKKPVKKSTSAKKKSSKKSTAKKSTAKKATKKKK